MNMKKNNLLSAALKNIIFLTLFFSIIFSGNQLYADYLFMTDGKIVKGKIINANKNITKYKKKDGAIKIVKSRKISRVLYHEFDFGKKLIKLKQGGEILAYLVYEDNDSYHFRRKLYNPNEFEILKKNVFFMTKTSPSNLKARSDGKKVFLTWVAPYSETSHYNIYIKTKNDIKYTLLRKTTDNQFVIAGLLKNTVYHLIVKAIDRFNDESSPSNEVEIALNKAPVKPKNLKSKKSVDEKLKEMTVFLQWEKPKEKGNNIFNVYLINKNGYFLIGETKENLFEKKGLSTSKSYNFVVRSASNNGNESEDSNIATPNIGMEIQFSPSFVYPVSGSIVNQNNAGGGVLVEGIINNLLVSNLEIGLQSGFWLFDGKYIGVKNSYFIPFGLTFNYRFKILSSFSFIPKISVGESLSVNTIDVDGVPLGEDPYYKTLNAFYPYLALGFKLSYNLELQSKTVFFQIGSDYNIVFDNLKGPIQFFSINAGIGFRFNI